MLEAAGNLEFEEAARLRDEIKRLRETELAVADDPLARQGDVAMRAGSFLPSPRTGERGGARQSKGGRAAASRPHKPTLAEMHSPDEVPLDTAAARSRLTGPAGLSPRSLARKNTLDEMTVGRTEVPLGGPKPERPASPHAGEGRGGETAGGSDLVRRGRIGTGSYEDPADERRNKRRPKKTGRPRH
jgi:excinuclease ABC subunit B